MTIQVLTKEDLSSIAQIHTSAFPESALTKLGPEIIRRYYLCELNEPNDNLCVGYFNNDTLVGFCFAGVSRGSEIVFFRKNFFYIIWRVITHPRLITENIIRERITYSMKSISHYLRKKKKKSVLVKPRTKKFGILSIAVDPQHRGQKIGRELMDLAETTAIEKGFTSMRLTVHPENTTAVLFYESLGWKKRLVNNLWEGYMEKDLTGYFPRRTVSFSNPPTNSR